MSLAAGRPSTRVSVVLAVHNPGPAIHATLRRLMRTLAEDDEVVLVDDGSTDGTADALRAWADARPWVRVVALPDNMGVAAARNRGLQHAQGETVWFVDWDDAWSADILDRLYAAWSASDATIAICGAEHVDERGVRLRRLGAALHRPLTLEGNDIGMAILEGRIQGYLWNKLFCRSILGEAVFPLVRSQSDFAGTAELIARQPKVTLIPDVLYAHIRRRGSLTNTRYATMDTFEQSLRIVERIADDLHKASDSRVADTDIVRAMLAFRYREYHLTVANTALRLSHDRDYRRQMLATATRGMRWADLGLLLSHAPSLAARAGVLLATRQRYPVVYDAYTSARRRTYRLRRQRHHYDRDGRSW